MTALASTEHTGGPPLVVEHREGVTRLTMDSPANRNALSRRLLEGLAQGLAQAAEEGSRLVVLTGTGSVFCSGADLAERLGPPPGAPAPGATMAEVLTAIAHAPSPVLARVNGHVRAGGMGLVAACDMAVAPESATFAFTEVRVGVAPAMIAVPTMRRMSRRSLERHMLTGTTFDALKAERAGLLTATAHDMEQVDMWVADVAEAIGRCAPGAVHATKDLLEELSGLPWGQAMAQAQGRSDGLFGSEEAAEGIRAFLEKRPAGWMTQPRAR